MARTRLSDERIWIGPGGVRQTGGSLPLYICNGCGREVVWAESRTTGRKYLANVFTGSGVYRTRYYIGASLHTVESCEAIVARRIEEDLDREIAAADAFAAWTTLRAVSAARDRGDEAEVKRLLAERRLLVAAL